MVNFRAGNVNLIWLSIYCENKYGGCFKMFKSILKKQGILDFSYINYKITVLI